MFSYVNVHVISWVFTPTTMLHLPRKTANYMIAWGCRVVMMITKDILELVRMLSELAYSLTVCFNTHIELLFCQNTELAISTPNTTVWCVSIHIGIEHSAQGHSSGLKCRKLCSPYLLIDDHLQVLVDVAEASHVL